MSARSLSLLLGKCVPSIKENAAKFAITELELDKNLLMYFSKVTYIYALDSEKKCKTGDIVLIEELKQKFSRLITHKVKEVVYPCGDIVDPISGKKVVTSNYREDMEDINQLYGKSVEAFDYNKAPPRGWQEGKKDFSDKETYYKYHEDNKEHPYAV